MKTGKILQNFWEEEAKKGIHGVVTGANLEASTIASMNLLLKHFNFDNKKILDAGCGIGRLTPTFSLYTNPAEVTGIDWADGMLNEAIKNVPTATFKKAPLWDIPFEDEYFDLTMAFTSLCHVMEDKFQDSLNELARVTKGEIVIVDSTRCSESLFIPHHYSWCRNTTDYTIPDFNLAFKNEYTLGEVTCPDSLRTLLYFKRKED